MQPFAPARATHVVDGDAEAFFPSVRNLHVRVLIRESIPGADPKENKGLNASFVTGHVRRSGGERTTTKLLVHTMKRVVF